MNSNFKDLLFGAIKGDKEDIACFIERLQPMIKHNGLIAGYDCAETDLIIFLLEKVKGLKWEKLESYNEAQLISYFKILTYNKAIDLYRKNCKITRSEYLSDIIENADYNDYFSDIFFYDLIDNLTDRQKKVIIYKIIYNLKDSEVAKRLHISRQAVNRLFNRALVTLRKEAEK